MYQSILFVVSFIPWGLHRLHCPRLHRRNLFRIRKYLISLRLASELLGSLLVLLASRSMVWFLQPSLVLLSSRLACSRRPYFLSLEPQQLSFRSSFLLPFLVQLLGRKGLIIKAQKWRLSLRTLFVPQLYLHFAFEQRDPWHLLPDLL